MSAEKNFEAWIEQEFGGYGVAVREKHEAPIPGEPFMSMDIAKELARSAHIKGLMEAREIAEKHMGFLQGGKTDVTTAGKISGIRNVIKLMSARIVNTEIDSRITALQSKDDGKA